MLIRDVSAWPPSLGAASFLPWHWRFAGYKWKVPWGCSNVFRQGVLALRLVFLGSEGIHSRREFECLCSMASCFTRCVGGTSLPSGYTGGSPITLFSDVSQLGRIAHLGVLWLPACDLCCEGLSVSLCLLFVPGRHSVLATVLGRLVSAQCGPAFQICRLCSCVGGLLRLFCLPLYCLLFPCICHP